MDDAVGTPPPQLTRLVKKVHTTESGTRVFTASFLVNTQQILMEDFEAAAHDAVLRHAHADGHMPVGPILVTTEEAVSEQLGKTCELCAGKGWLFEQDQQDCPDCTAGKIKPPATPFIGRSIEELEIDNGIMMSTLVQVHGSVELGLSL